MPVDGAALAVGSKLPSFSVVANDMSLLTNSSFSGKVLVVSLIPSLDTPVCSIETKKFNSDAAEFKDKATILTVSADLPFAQARWCGAEGAKNLTTASCYKDTKAFGTAFGAFIPAMSLLARAVFVVDASGTVQHVEYVKELAEEPNYDAVNKKVRELL